MRHYTVLEGSSSKLMSTQNDMSRTVTSIGDTVIAQQLRDSLNTLYCDLVLWSGDTTRMIAELKLLGCRENEVFEDVGNDEYIAWAFWLEQLADKEIATTAWRDGFHPVSRSLGEILTVTGISEASKIAVRSELKDVLRLFSGVVPNATVWDVEGELEVTVVEYLRNGDNVLEFVEALFSQNRLGKSGITADEMVLAYYDGLHNHPLEGTLSGLLEKEWNIEVSVNEYAVVKWLGANRPEVLVAVRKSGTAIKL